MANNIHISFDKVLVPYVEASNRLKYFSAIGQKGAEHTKEITDFSITQDGGIRYGINTPNEDSLSSFISFFPLWLNAILLRDLFEGFAYAYDRIYEICYISSVAQDGKILAGTTDPKKVEDFSKLGFENKRKNLRAEFGIDFSSADYKKIFKGIKDVRNCITHSRARVTPDLGHSAGKDMRYISWLTMRFFIGTDKLEIGKVHRGPNLMIKIAEHKKEIKIGEPLTFTREEIVEIEFTMQNMARDLLNQAKRFVESKNIPHREAV